LLISRQSTTTRQVTYEPSYAAFESAPGEIAKEPEKKIGRRIFGSFVPDIDVLLLACISILTTYRTLSRRLEMRRKKQKTKTMNINNNHRC